MLRPVLETAVAVASAGEQADPPVPGPPALRPFFRFARLPSRALDVARRVLDDQPEFRARVREVAVVDRDLVGPGGWLLLDRPEGWEDELAELVRGAGQRDDARDLRRAVRRAEQLRAGLDRAEAELVELRARVDRLEAAVAREERARRAAEDERDEARVDAEVAREERALAIRELKAVEARLASRTAEWKQARRQLAEHREAAATRPESVGGDSPPSTPAVDVGAVRAALEHARGAATRVDQLLGEATALLGGEVAEPGSSRQRSPRGRAATPSRRPARLPGGLFDDTAAAAEHLLRLPGAVVLVDGYNVAKTAWPSLSLPAQRDRLVEMVAVIGARTGADPVVVFDGADVAPEPRGAQTRHVQVRFSPAGVEADDVVLAAIDDYPPERPLVVVSDDRRVRDGARAAGANVVGVRQLLALA